MPLATDKKMLDQIRRIKIISKRLVDSHISGDYSSAFKGVGFEFDQLREYQFGDDVRFINWNASAKSDSIMIKEFIPERDRTVILAVDCSSSLAYSSQPDLKRDLIVSTAAALAFIANASNDRVGLLLFSEGVKTWMAPQKGKLVVTKIVDELCSAVESGGKTDILEALRFLAGTKSSNCVLFIISDWISDQECLRRELKVVARKHEAVAVRVLDPLEGRLPAVGVLEIEDPETGHRMVIDSSCTRLAEKISLRLKAQSRMFEGCGLDLLDLRVGDRIDRQLARFFNRRTKRLK